MTQKNKAIDTKYTQMNSNVAMCMGYTYANNSLFIIQCTNQFAKPRI